MFYLRSCAIAVDDINAGYVQPCVLDEYKTKMGDAPRPKASSGCYVGANDHCILEDESGYVLLYGTRVSFELGLCFSGG